MKYKTVTALAALSLTQCTSLDIEECMHADWYSFGLNDGNSGTTPYTLNNYIQDCSEFGLGVDSTQWRAGYQIGLKNYCQPENGYMLGLEGAYYNGVCGSNDFLKRYNEGHRKYEIRQRISTVKTRLNTIENEIAQATSAISSSIDVPNNKERKNSLKRERKQLEQELLLLRIGAPDAFSIQFNF